MCGLVGICTFGTQLAEQTISVGLDSLIHRGPDDYGTYIHVGSNVVGLGLRRLAIQDLSNLGHQPMHSIDGRYVIAFNGEITNFQQLRDQLRSHGFNFYSNSDTEVLLNSWIFYGKDCLSHLEGMFAFSILDKCLNTLTLVRDPFGIKPLYYSKSSDGSFLFSSEVSSLNKMMRRKLIINWQRAIDYLQWGLYDESEETFVDGVYQVLPGHLIRIDLNTSTVNKQEVYWNPIISDNKTTIQEASECVRELFIESVRRNLVSDVPVGIAVSGGLDSSSILRSAATLQPQRELYVFSYLAEGQQINESKWINEAVKGLNVKYRAIKIGETDLAHDLDDLVLSQGEPFGSTSVYASWRVFKAVREDGIVVTLDGQGADEVFAGYDGYPSSVLRSLVKAGDYVKAYRFLGQWSNWPGRSKAVAIKGAFAESSPDWVYAVAGLLSRDSGIPRLNMNPLKDRGITFSFPRREMILDLKKSPNFLKSELLSGLRYRGLPALLRHGDRNSMSASVESRVPFLDRGLVEYVLSLPESFLVGSNGETKKILRYAMKGIVPEPIIKRRDKIGFETPQGLWLNHLFSEHGSHLNDIMRSSNLFIEKQTKSGEFWTELRQNNAATWRVVNFLKWIELNGIETDL